MITSDAELKATLDRIRHFHAQVAHLRKVETNPVNYRLSAGGFLAEIDRMQLDVREFLAVHPAEANTRGQTASRARSRRGRRQQSGKNKGTVRAGAERR